MGIAAFGPLILMALNLFPNQTEAALAFATVAALGGLIGTPIGAAFSDAIARRSRARIATRERLYGKGEQRGKFYDSLAQVRD